MKFTFGSGQRVLDSYSLKRGIGRGGFGEVYYAVSDGGKEVALKLVQGNNLDVELRGMAQCLNLKHPNLLTLYDLRTDAQGDHWVVMEYIAGEPLSVVLNRHPQGLPPDLARQWFLTLARAVGYLHDHGIVHRDLKPANIFVENGLVKVGDYGLCKFISGSQRTAQTQSVGTVHYMAPEIATGNYSKQVDVYAAGIILYEMLTGRVPFDGESAGEILMKHLTAPPDLTKLPPEYVACVGKALAKNPAHRYGGMADMIRAVEAIGAEAAPAAGPGGKKPAPGPQKRPGLAEALPMALPVHSGRGQAAELCGSLSLAAVLAGLFSILWTRVGGLSDLAEIGTGFFLTVAASWAVLVPAKVWNTRRGDAGLRRALMLVLGMGLGLGMLWLDGWPMGVEALWSGVRHSPGGNGIPALAGYLSYFALGFFALRWWKMADRYRPQRFSFAPVLAAGFWAVVLLCVWPFADRPTPWGAVALVATSVIVQLVSPWEPRPRPAGKPVRLRYA